MSPKERNVEFLKEIVRRIYAAMVRTEYLVYEMFPQIRPSLPSRFISYIPRIYYKNILPLHRKNGKTLLPRNTEPYSSSASDAN